MRAATILIVDDQQQVLEMAELMLRAAGYGVYGARNATDALAIASQVGCGLNLLLTDMIMPEIDGHELILAIRPDILVRFRYCRARRPRHLIRRRRSGSMRPPCSGTHPIK
jgi:two-component system, cell cycle sensor histidine kinase and response regulator CckA